VALVTAQPETSPLAVAASLAIPKARKLKRSRLQGITVPESEVCEDNVLEASVDATSATAPDVVQPLNKTVDTLIDLMKDHCSLAAQQKKDQLEIDTDDQANYTARKKKDVEELANLAAQQKSEAENHAILAAKQKPDDEVIGNLTAQQKNDAEEDKSVVGGKRKERSDDDTDETTYSDRKFMQDLVASVTKMEQQFTKLLETRPDVNPYQRSANDEYVKEEHGGHSNETRDVIDLVDSTDDSSESNDTQSEQATRRFLNVHHPAPKKIKVENNAGGTDVRSMLRPTSPRRQKSAGKLAKVPSYTKRKQLRDCSYRNWISGMKWNSNPDKSELSSQNAL
jgi:hypothetical protein